MAANKAFLADVDGAICHRCKRPIIRNEHWMVIYNRPQKGTTFHAVCEFPTQVTDGSEFVEPTFEPTPSNGNSSVEKAIRDLIEATTPKPATLDTEAIREQVNAIAKEEIAKLVVPQNITIKVDNREYKLEGIKPHKDFAKVLYLATKRRNIYLWGDPGWGKSECVRRIAEAFGLAYRFMTLTFQTSDTRVTGFIDGHGQYHSTAFRETYGDDGPGGVFSFDEADLANGNTISAMNNPLANGHGEFPNGQVARHKDFICFATGNTNGNGANANFPDSRPLNQAFRDRFFFFKWEEDKEFERTIALGINPQAAPWIEWVQAVRQFVKANNLQMVVSPRATYEGANYLHDGVLSVPEIAEGVLWRGTKAETVNRILAAHPYPQGGAQ